MYMFKYICKRVSLMLMVFTVIFVTCFVLIRLVPINTSVGLGQDKDILMAQIESRGYNDPIPEQLFNYVKNAVNGVVKTVTTGDFDNFLNGFGQAYDKMPNIKMGTPVMKVFIERLPPSILINIYSSLFAVPIGIALGIFAALKKNKWQDHVISTAVMVVISVPSFVYGSLFLYVVCFKLGLLPKQLESLINISNLYGIPYVPLSPNWELYFNKEMFLSMLPAVLCMSFGSIAGYTRFTRAELTEVLTSEFMLLARTKGLTKSQATVRHALRNAMVPIFPSIIGEFLSVLSGSLVIEKIFSIPGVGALYLNAINAQDYDFFMLLSSFYLIVGLAAGLVIDLSYGFIDPRIRMGAK